MMRLDPDGILRRTFVRDMEYREEVGSTNDLAIELAADASRQMPLLVLAERQTGGRGRGENKWWASDGSLTYSVVLHAGAMDLPNTCWPRLSLTVGLSVCQTLEALLPDNMVRLKWPNDVYVERRKVCGVLVETVSQLPKVIVIGIGINVNNSIASAANELRSIAVSMTDVAGKRFDRTEVLVRQLQQLDEHMSSLATSREQLAEAWRSRCMLEGRTVTISLGARSSTGVCQGIDDEGALLLQSEGGIERCVAGVVTRIL